MKRILLALAVLCASFSACFAQNLTNTIPYATTAYITSATINTSNTFQPLFNASTTIRTGRVDCLIQNNGAATMFIYFGPITDTAAITSNALQLSSGSIFRCGNSGVMLNNAISITGTAGQRFFAYQE